LAWPGAWAELPWFVGALSPAAVSLGAVSELDEPDVETVVAVGVAAVLVGEGSVGLAGGPDVVLVGGDAVASAGAGTLGVALESLPTPPLDAPADAGESGVSGLDAVDVAGEAIAAGSLDPVPAAVWLVPPPPAGPGSGGAVVAVPAGPGVPPAADWLGEPAPRPGRVTVVGEGAAADAPTRRLSGGEGDDDLPADHEAAVVEARINALVGAVVDIAEPAALWERARCGARADGAWLVTSLTPAAPVAIAATVKTFAAMPLAPSDPTPTAAPSAPAAVMPATPEPASTVPPPEVAAHAANAPPPPSVAPSTAFLSSPDSATGRMSASAER
jgi:hypothetical protein